MKTFFGFLIFLCACYTGLCQELDYAVKLKLKPHSDKSYLATKDAEIIRLASKHSVTITQSWWIPNSPPELYLYYDLRVKGSTSKENRESFIKDFLATGKFESEVYEYGITYLNSCNNPVSVDDPSFVNGDGWPLRMIEAPCAWSITKGNANVLIGVADTEFRTTHEDLQNKFYTVNGASSAGHPHGTKVSSIAAASTNNRTGLAGIGYNSRIAAHRIVHDSLGLASPLYIRAAIQNLHNMGVKIINVSWSSTALIRYEVEAITQAGTTLVLCGGNTPSSQDHGDIADIPGVIVVSGVNSSNMNGPTGFARNKYIDICAPSVDIITADGNSNTGYSLSRGTSYAAPFVSGTIALMLSVNPNLTPEFIEQIIKATADPVSDGNSYPGLLGTGRLNAYKAVQASITSISGSSNICYGSSYEFSTTNAPAGFTWNKSSNLNISGSGNSITVSASSNNSGSGWVSVNYGHVNK